MNYSLKLKKLRLEKNLSQQDVAKELGIARQTYNHYEVEENIIPLKHLNNLANFYDVSIDYILGFTKLRKYPNSRKEIDILVSSERLKEFRLEKKLTQGKLAENLNTFHTVVVDYEHAKNLIATSFLYMISKKYKFSADYLLGKVEEPKYL